MIEFKEVWEQATPAVIGFGVALPALVTGGALAAATRLPPRVGGLLSGVALAAGVCAGYFAVRLGPVWYWAPGNHWLPHLTVLAIPAAWVAARSRAFGNVAPTTLITGIATALVVRDSLRMQLFWGVALGYASAFSALALIYSRMSGARTALAMTLVSAAAGCICHESALARVAGVLVASCAAAALVFAAFDRDAEKSLARGLAPGFAVLLTAMMFSEYQRPDAELPPSSYALIMLAPAVLLVTRVPRFERLPGILRATIPFVLLAIPLIIAVRQAALM